MNSEEQNQFVTRADLDLLRNQLDQIMTALRDANIQGTLVNDVAQTRSAQISVRNQVIQEHTLVRDGHSSSVDAMEYRSFAFSGPDPQKVVPVKKTRDPRDIELMEECRALKRKFDAITDQNTTDLNALNMCLVPDLVIPPGFKAPKFKKYKGDSCPKQHLVMFCRGMTSHVLNNKLMIHCFQYSLSGVSLHWYMQLESNRIQSWLDLAVAFVKQYDYNLYLAPSHLHLLDLSQEENESFRKYAQRWREVADRVQPPLSDKELVKWFVDTLQGAYREKLFSMVTLNFSEVVKVGERIESGLRRGKIQGTLHIPINENESIISVSASEAPTTQSYHPYNSNAQNQQPFDSQCQTYQRQLLFPRPPLYQRSYHRQPLRHAQQRPRKPKRNFTPLPMSYSQFLPELIHNGLIVPRGINPMIPPYPLGFDVNARCDYHAGAHGHSTEDCKVLRSKIQTLLDYNVFSFTPQGIQINGPSPDQVNSSHPEEEETANNRCEDDSQDRF